MAERGRDGLVGLDVGTNYLDVCWRAADLGDDTALAVLDGITSVLAGLQDEFYMEYPCHEPTARAWYSLCVTPLGDGLGAVLSHQAITDLRSSQERLAEREAQLRAIFEASLDAILVVDDDGRYVDANRAASALLGYSREELLRMGVADVVSIPPGQDFSERWAAFRARDADGEEFVLYRKDGTAVEVEQRATLDVLPGVHLAVIRDITERKAAEAALADVSRQNAAILESIGDGFYALDRDWRFTYVNAQAGVLLNREPEDLVGQVVWEAFPRTLSSPFETHYRRAVETGRAETFEAYYPKPLEGYYAVRVFPYEEGLSVYFQDVTEAKQAEAALRESEERLRLVSQATNDTVWDWDLRTETVAMSGGFADGFGWEEPASGGFTIGWMLERIHPDDRERVGASLYDAVGEDGQGWTVEYRFERADGTWADVVNRSSIVRNDEGMAVRIVGAVVDLSARKAVERALIEAKEAAEEMARAKSSLLSNMSHELRTPLTAIIGFSELLGEAVDPDLHGLVEPIARGGRRLLDTLNSVLDVAQLEAGTTSLSSAAVDVRAEADDVVAALRIPALKKGLRLTCTGADVYALADRAALSRVLMNLVGNAVKFTERGTVQVDVWAEGENAWLRVADTGVGIAPAFLPHAFDGFQQESRGDSRGFEGNGLGLTITRGLVALMGGEITVTSEKGVGSTFTVRLPAA